MATDYKKLSILDPSEIQLQQSSGGSSAMIIPQIVPLPDSPKQAVETTSSSPSLAEGLAPAIVSAYPSLHRQSLKALSSIAIPDPHFTEENFDTTLNPSALGISSETQDEEAKQLWEEALSAGLLALEMGVDPFKDLEKPYQDLDDMDIKSSTGPHAVAATPTSDATTNKALPSTKTTNSAKKKRAHRKRKHIKTP